MPQKSFAAQIDDWVKQTEARQVAVFKESAQRVVEEMQKPVAEGGNMPVDTGFLRASLQGAIGAPSEETPELRSAEATEQDIVLTIAKMRPGETFYATYGADYAAAVNYGTARMRGYRFVDKAAQKWQAIVRAVIDEAKARVARN